MSYRHQTEEMAVKSSQNEMIRMSFYSTRHWSCYSRSPILKFHFRNIPTSLIRHQPFQSCQGQHGLEKWIKGNQVSQGWPSGPDGQQILLRECWAPDLASHTRVSFLLTPTAVPEKAANQPVGGMQSSGSNAGSAYISQPSVQYLALHPMLFVLRFVFLHGKHTNAMCHLFIPHPSAPENVVLSVCRHEPRLLGFPALIHIL